MPFTQILWPFCWRIFTRVKTKHTHTQSIQLCKQIICVMTFSFHKGSIELWFLWSVYIFARFMLYLFMSLLFFCRNFYFINAQIGWTFLINFEMKYTFGSLILNFKVLHCKHIRCASNCDRSKDQNQKMGYESFCALLLLSATWWRCASYRNER